MTAFTVTHDYRFDRTGKLDADDWLLIPRAELKPDFTLDARLADEMVRRYFEIVAHYGIVPTPVIEESGKIRVRSLMGKTALLLEDAERLLEARRVETSWRIAGGFLLAHRVSYGGRFFIGAAFEDDGSALKLYSLIRRYTPRLINYFGVDRGIAIYDRTQGALHKRIQEEFLNELAARLIRATVPQNSPAGF